MSHRGLITSVAAMAVAAVMVTGVAQADGGGVGSLTDGRLRARRHGVGGRQSVRQDLATCPRRRIAGSQRAIAGRGQGLGSE